jgi:cytoskeletal protein CcmA (bactofilin family)
LFKKKKPRTEGMESFDTLVGKSSVIQGRMTVHDSLRIDGKVFGNLEPADKYPCSIAVGNIHCNKAYIAGKVIGNIFAKELIMLSDCAVVHGDISAEAFTIANGAVIEGTMLQANRKIRGPQSAQLRSSLPA